jgi:hypothetical protein
MDGLGAESEEKREPASDIEAAVVDSLKVLDPERPIREADMRRSTRSVALVANDPQQTSRVCSQIFAGANTEGLRCFPSNSNPVT